MDNINNIDLIELIKNIHPLNFQYIEEQPYYKTFSLIIDKTLLNYKDFYYNDIIKHIAKSPLIKNPIPMITQSYQVSQDSGESKTWEVESFNTNLAGLWLKTNINNCEYNIICDSYVKASHSLELSIRVYKEYFDFIDKQFIENLIEYVKEFLNQQYTLSIKLFINNLCKIYNLSTEEILIFFQRLSKYKDIFNEFISVFTSGYSKTKFPTKKLDFKPSKIAVNKQGISAIDLFEKNNLSPFEAYKQLLELAENEINENI
jgi:hypothetical protein